jgi:hypothetical protein
VIQVAMVVADCAHLAARHAVVGGHCLVYAQPVAGRCLATCGMMRMLI